MMHLGISNSLIVNPTPCLSCTVPPSLLVLQAQALHPLADMSAVRCIIQQLGDELIRRLDSAGAASDSMQVRGPVVMVIAASLLHMCTHTLHKSAQVAMSLCLWHEGRLFFTGNHVAMSHVTAYTHALQLPAGLGVAQRAVVLFPISDPAPNCSSSSHKHKRPQVACISSGCRCYLDKYWYPISH